MTGPSSLQAVASPTPELGTARDRGRGDRQALLRLRSEGESEEVRASSPRTLFHPQRTCIWRGRRSSRQRFCSSSRSLVWGRPCASCPLAVTPSLLKYHCTNCPFVSSSRTSLPVDRGGNEVFPSCVENVDGVTKLSRTSLSLDIPSCASLASGREHSPGWSTPESRPSRQPRFRRLDSATIDGVTSGTQVGGTAKHPSAADEVWRPSIASDGVQSCSISSEQLGASSPADSWSASGGSSESYKPDSSLVVASSAATLSPTSCGASRASPFPTTSPPPAVVPSRLVLETLHPPDASLEGCSEACDACPSCLDVCENPQCTTCMPLRSRAGVLIFPGGPPSPPPPSVASADSLDPSPPTCGLHAAGAVREQEASQPVRSLPSCLSTSDSALTAATQAEGARAASAPASGVPRRREVVVGGYRSPWMPSKCWEVSSSPLGSLPAYTRCQIERYCRNGACWLVAHGCVYDALPILYVHPGGPGCLLRRALNQTDCSKDFDFHSRKGKQLWSKLLVGKVKPCPGWEARKSPLGGMQDDGRDKDADKSQNSPRSPPDARCSADEFRQQEAREAVCDPCRPDSLATWRDRPKGGDRSGGWCRLQ